MEKKRTIFITAALTFVFAFQAFASPVTDAFGAYDSYLKTGEETSYVKADGNGVYIYIDSNYRDETDQEFYVRVSEGLLEVRPDLYFIDADWSIVRAYNMLGEQGICVRYLFDRSWELDADSIWAYLDSIIESAGVTSDMSDNEKVYRVVMRIAELYTYDADTSYERARSQQSSFYESLLSDGISFCAMDARLFLGCMYRLGIESKYVYGRLSDTAHGWAKVKLDGVWYDVDVTMMRNIIDNDFNPEAFYIFDSNAQGYVIQYTVDTYVKPENEAAQPESEEMAEEETEKAEVPAGPGIIYDPVIADEAVWEEF